MILYRCNMTETVFEFQFAVTTSVLPSPLTSITAMALEPFPATNLYWDEKLPGPFPSNQVITEHRQPFRPRVEIFEYIEPFYNRKHIHQSLDYETPLMYEKSVA